MYESLFNFFFLSALTILVLGFTLNPIEKKVFLGCTKVSEVVWYNTETEKPFKVQACYEYERIPEDKPK